MLQPKIHCYEYSLVRKKFMCKTELVVKRSLCSVTVCRDCNVYVLHIGPMSFRLEEDILDEVSAMFTEY